VSRRCAAVLVVQYLLPVCISWPWCLV